MLPLICCCADLVGFQELRTKLADVEQELVATQATVQEQKDQILRLQERLEAASAAPGGHDGGQLTMRDAIRDLEQLRGQRAELEQQLAYVRIA